MDNKVKVKGKTRINARIPADLDAWVKKYAKDNNTNMTKLIVDYFIELRKNSETDNVPQL